MASVSKNTMAKGWWSFRQKLIDFQQEVLVANKTEALMIHAARKAGFAAKLWREEQLRERQSIPTERKLDGSIVTAADSLAQSEIQATVMRLDSAAEFIGEEGVASKASLGTFNPGTRVFVVDPIDGTNSFVQGKPNWSVSIAYIEIVEQATVGRILKPIATVVYAPDKDELYYADESGAVIEKDGKRESLCVLAVSSDIRPMMTFYCKKIADTDTTEPQRKAMQQAAADSQYEIDANKGSPALSLAAAANVRNNIVITREDDPFQSVTASAVAPWDTLAGRFIYKQAGGKFPSHADQHGNVAVTGNLIISLMAPSEEMADAALAWLTKSNQPKTAVFFPAV